MNEFIGKTLRVVEGLDRVLIDDYEKLLADRDARNGNLAADLLEERAQRRQLAEALVTVTAERDTAQQMLSDQVDAMLDEGWKQVGYDIERQERFRLAWKSAAYRAYQRRNAIDALNRALVEHRQLITSHERTVELLRAATRTDPLSPEGFGRLREALAGQLTDEQVDERVEKIKCAAAEQIEVRRLREALNEERIEKDGPS